MFSLIQWVSLGGSLFFLFVIFLLMRQKKLNEAYALLWLFVDLILIVLSLWTQGLLFLSELIGIWYPPATLFLVMIGGILLILLQYSLLLSKNQMRIMQLGQEVAMLRAELEILRKTRKDDSKDA
ncbi:MAG: DUF2304 domain-containing protein [Victivallaceae bacterium]|nr:DUF2304 domain-containing protein [Victivallaceae bacterium]